MPCATLCNLLIEYKCWDRSRNHTLEAAFYSSESHICDNGELVLTCVKVKQATSQISLQCFPLMTPDYLVLYGFHPSIHASFHFLTVFLLQGPGGWSQSQLPAARGSDHLGQVDSSSHGWHKKNKKQFTLTFTTVRQSRRTWTRRKYANSAQKSPWPPGVSTFTFNTIILEDLNLILKNL